MFNRNKPYAYSPETIRKRNKQIQYGHKIERKTKALALKKKVWTESDEKAHQSDVKAGRSFNKQGRLGAKNPHL